MTIKGFSMVEIMVVTAIFALMVSGLLTSLAVGNRSWQNSENGVAIVRDARNALWVMSKDLRKGSGSTLTQSASAVTLVFSTPSEGSVTYSWANSGANTNQLIRTTATRTRILANKISALSFTDQSTSMKINLTVTRTPDAGGSSSNMSLVEEVAYR